MSLLIKNGHVIDPEIKLDMVRDVLIQDDRIVRVDEDISEAADEVIDAMRAIGRSMSEDIRETGKGGLAGTPTGVEIRERMSGTI